MKKKQLKDCFIQELLTAPLEIFFPTLLPMNENKSHGIPHSMFINEI